MLESILNWVFLKIRENEMLRAEFLSVLGIDNLMTKRISEDAITRGALHGESNLSDFIRAEVRKNVELRDDLRNALSLGEFIAREVSIVKDRNLILFVSNSLSDKEVDELKDALEMLMPHNSYLVIQSDEPVAAIRV
jgi:hypothetical protein